MEKRYDVPGLRDFLKKEIIGQTKAIDRVCDALERGERGVVLAGPCGCGKTLIARKMSEYFYGMEYSMRQFDMFGLHKEQYVEDVKKLILEHLAERPDALFLFDEIQWPCTKMRNMLFTLLADKTVATWEGEVLPMEKTFLILTAKGDLDFYLDECASTELKETLRSHWVELDPLTPDELRECILRKMKRAENGAKRIHVKLSWDETVPEAIYQAMEKPACGRAAFHQVEEWKTQLWHKIYNLVELGEDASEYLTVHTKAYAGTEESLEVEIGHEAK